MTQSIVVTLDITTDGRVTLRGPDLVAAEAAAFETAEKRKPRPPELDVPFDEDYANRVGYAADFLQTPNLSVSVPLPTLSPELQAASTKLNGTPDENVLKYDGYSAVMHAARRQAIYTAANVDGGNRFQLGRPGDKWRFDPRIPAAAQIDNNYYKNNKFDRGHLTRREDMEYGDKPVSAIARADDTLHWTNCSPQHSGFNQSKELWQGLERHILEGSIRAERFAAQVFTGPILAVDDPVWARFPDIQYPARYWKVAAAMTASGKLFAAGFILDQTDVIARLGIEGADGEVPFGAFKTFQVPIREIERMTGLAFPCAEPGGATFLRDVDPLNGPAGLQRAAAALADMDPAFEIGLIPPGYVFLQDSVSIVRE